MPYVPSCDSLAFLSEAIQNRTHWVLLTESKKGHGVMTTILYEIGELIDWKFDPHIGVFEWMNTTIKMISFSAFDRSEVSEIVINRALRIEGIDRSFNADNRVGILTPKNSSSLFGIINSIVTGKYINVSNPELN